MKCGDLVEFTLGNRTIRGVIRSSPVDSMPYVVDAMGQGALVPIQLLRFIDSNYNHPLTNIFK